MSTEIYAARERELEQMRWRGERERARMRSDTNNGVYIVGEEVYCVEGCIIPSAHAPRSDQVYVIEKVYDDEYISLEECEGLWVVGRFKKHAKYIPLPEDLFTLED